MKFIDINQFKSELLKGTPVMDVRAAVEFNTGSIPGSINIPILSDEERKEVGTCYKKQGREAAIQLGESLVSGENLQQKVSQWSQQFHKSPQTIVTCFRGGLRSQFTQKFLADAGISSVRLQHGYKSARQFFIDQIQDFSEKTPMLLLSGTTGSGKTQVLNQLGSEYPNIDLENLAKHRGSAFGAMIEAQPSQADFENQLALQSLKVELNNRPLLLEDESRLIGSCYIPENFFMKMREGPVLLLQEDLESRIDMIYDDYISSQLNEGSSFEQAQQLFEKYKGAIAKIQKKLGGLRAQELLEDLQICVNDFWLNKSLERNKIWIEKLLVWYYDPMYTSSLSTRNPKIIFQGSREEIIAYLRLQK